MKRLISCEYDFNNCCVELKFTDGSMIAIGTITVCFYTFAHSVEEIVTFVCYNKLFSALRRLQ